MQILGPTTYAFSTVVAIFIVGIAGGAAIGSRLAARACNPAVGLACSLLISAGLALAAASGVDWALLTIARDRVAARISVRRRAAARSAARVGAAAADDDRLRRGVSLCVRARPAARDEAVTEHIGLIYAINTLGAILGSLLAGFVLVPQDRPARHHSPRRRDRRDHGDRDSRRGPARGRVAASARRSRLAGRRGGRGHRVVPQWDRALLSSGAYKYAAGDARAEPRDRADRRRAAVVSRRLDRHGRGPPADRHHLAGHRRQGRRVERRRHADAAPARARAAAAASRIRSARRSSGSAAASRWARRSPIRSPRPPCSRSRRRSSRRRGSSKPRTIARSPIRARA